jgi:hypothetical protein
MWFTAWLRQIQHGSQSIITKNKGTDRNFHQDYLGPTTRCALREHREMNTASFNQKSHVFPHGILGTKNPTLPFIPNLDRRPYLLIMMKRITNRTQAKAASPTAMDTYEDQHRQSGMVMENMSAFKVTCVPR